MEFLSPKSAANFANTIYQAQSEVTVKAFLKNPIFSREKGDSKHLKATVGFRIINANDGFGICARGSEKYEGGKYKNDLFIMFRGTTTKNYGAD
ncbi:MAG: hypothetical protein GY829_12080, partial [Gammaproteobacteria bacterium]|nr:hypothetical protein [Gammaproteobacteria bacterium]